MVFHDRMSADGLETISGQSSAPISRVRDVVVISPTTSSGDEALDLLLVPGFDRQTMQQTPAPEVELGHDITITRLEQTEADRVMNACTPRGHNFYPYRQFGQGYTLSCEIDPDSLGSHHYAWDPANKLRDVLAMTRLIVDAAYSTEYAARIIDHSDGHQQIVWVPEAAGKYVYRASNDRDWLTYQEARELKDLLAARWGLESQLGLRLNRAMWNLEFAATLAWLDVIVPVYVITMESFASATTRGVRRQFVKRAPQIAQRAGCSDLDESICESLYGARSRWAHGEHIRLVPSAGSSSEGEVPSPQQDIAREFRTLQNATRSVVRCAIENPDFRELVSTDEAVQANWPVPPP